MSIYLPSQPKSSKSASDTIKVKDLKPGSLQKLGPGKFPKPYHPLDDDPDESFFSWLARGRYKFFTQAWNTERRKKYEPEGFDQPWYKFLHVWGFVATTIGRILCLNSSSSFTLSFNPFQKQSHSDHRRNAHLQ